MNHSREIIQRLWSYCSILRDDGLSYPDYVEQLTYLLFLKMANETAVSGDSINVVPPGLDWPSLVERRGDDLHKHYAHILSELGQQAGMLSLIFRDASNKIRDPQKLRLLIVDLIDSRNWSALDIDVKGDAYEGLLEKNAQDTKSGAGQYFTPRPLVEAIVECISPQLGETVYDPACGTGGFLIAAHQYLREHNPVLASAQEQHLRLKAIRGSELVAEVTRLATMNLFLHGIGSTDASDTPPIVTEDSLVAPVREQYEVILTNPPFGKRSSTTLVTRAGAASEERLHVLREDLWVSTSNKELNFLQHVAVSLKPGGRAAVVVPDGVLSGPGAGVGIRERLLDDFDVHTLLRLPTGIFYAAGVNANVLFFERRTDRRKSSDERIWVYDLRTYKRFTLVGNRLDRSDLAEFVRLYGSSDRQGRAATWTESDAEGRWRSFTVPEVRRRADCNLDLFWLGDRGIQAEEGPQESVDEIVDEIVADLQLALAEMAKLRSDTGSLSKDQPLD
jgi:type I restriction enzyme M protein